MHRGFVKVYRKVVDGVVFSDPPAFHLFMYLLLMANHKKGYVYGKEVGVGQHLTGRKALALAVGYSESGVEKIIKRLIEYKLLEQQTFNKYRVLTIVNYQKFTLAEQQSDNRVTTECQQSNTNKNDKNDKNDNTINYQAYLEEWNNSLDNKIKSLSSNRAAKIKTRVQENKSFFTDFCFSIQKIKESAFLKGDNDKKWIATFDWIIANDTNYIKVLEGNYKNREIKRNGGKLYECSGW